MNTLSKKSLILFVLLLGALATIAAVARGRGRDERVAAGQFDYYLMALSWSPTYCETHPGETEQCGRKGYGFILHGLWPQYLSGMGPQHCPMTATPDARTVDRTLAFMPSRRLIEHEWETHGTCSGLTPTAYFDLADRAFASIHVPTELTAPSQSPQMSADQVTAAFIAANPGLTEQMLAVQCHAAELEEVRICLNFELRPQVCGKRVTTHCRDGNLRIPARR
jgi:ribonuclease T2